MKIKEIFMAFIKKISLLFRKNNSPLLIEQSTNENTDVPLSSEKESTISMYEETDLENVALNIRKKRANLDYYSYEHIFYHCKIYFDGEKRYLGELIVYYLNMDWGDSILEEEENFLDTLSLLDNNEIFISKKKYQYNISSNEHINDYIDINRDIELENTIYSLMIDDDLWFNNILELDSDRVNKIYDLIYQLKKLQDEITYNHSLLNKEKEKLFDDLDSKHFWEIFKKNEIKDKLSDVNKNLFEYGNMSERLNYENKTNQLVDIISKIINISQYRFVKLCFAIAYSKLVYRNMFTDDLLD